MFTRRINARTARMYRHAIINGINQARDEFKHARLTATPALWPGGQAPISETITMMELEAKAYRAEKRKRGWVSKPKTEDTSRRGDRNLAVHVAAISGMF